jgi:hypothetical protein
VNGLEPLALQKPGLLARILDRKTILASRPGFTLDCVLCVLRQGSGVALRVVAK